MHPALRLLEETHRVLEAPLREGSEPSVAQFSSPFGAFPRRETTLLGAGRWRLLALFRHLRGQRPSAREEQRDQGS